MVKRVLVLYGGMNSEHEVSLTSGAGVLRALLDQGYEAEAFIVTQDIQALVQKLIDFKPDVVANVLHGTMGEDGHIQALLEAMGFPHTGSSVLASALAMNKPKAKILFRDAGIPCVEDSLLTLEECQKNPPFSFPFVIKPPTEGSSVGVYIINTPEDLSALDAKNDPYLQGEIMAEPYIPGMEVSVAVMGDKALGTLELRPKSGFYDYKNKYEDGMTEHFCPAPLPQETEAEILAYTEKAVAALGLEGVSRADWRVDMTQNPAKPYILEVNTQPGLTELSIVPDITRSQGISFEELARFMVENPRQPFQFSRKDDLCLNGRKEPSAPQPSGSSLAS